MPNVDFRRSPVLNAKLTYAWVKRKVLLARGRLDYHVVYPGLAVGAGMPHRLAAPALHHHGFTAYLDVRMPTERGGDWSHVAEGVHVKWLPIRDLSAFTLEQIDEGTAWILEQMRAKRTVLVTCRAGQGRSVTMVLAALMRLGHTLDDAQALLARSGRIINVTPPQKVLLAELAARQGADAVVGEAHEVGHAN